MKKTTRIISLLLTLAMMLTLAVPMTVSASFTDVDANHVYHEAINNLSAEGILNGFEDGSFKPGDPVTRAQFTKIICYALSVGGLSYSEAERSIFTDVAPDHWAANNIVTAYKQGIINGMGDGTFAPEANVNYEQAVKMVVCALGYEQSATNLGGYPYGYLSVANSKKIISGIVDCAIGQAMNRGAVAKLIDNMLNTEQVDEDGITGGSIRDEVSTAKKVSAKLIAGYGVALYDGVNPCYKNQIQLELREGDEEDELFIISEVEDFDINEYIGRYVTVYYETEQGSSDKVVTSISLQSKKNEEIEISLDAICKYDSTSIEYYTDDEQTETETVYYSSPDVLFNGEYTDSSVKDLLDDNYSKSGSITLISAGSGDAAGVVFIKAYELLIVSHTDKTNKKIYAKNDPYTGGIVADTTDKSKKVTITKSGKDYAFNSLKQNDILSVAKSESGKIIEILVSRNSIATGTIIVTNGNNKQIKLDSGSKTYTLLDNIHTVYGTQDDIVVSKHISLYIDDFGNGAMIIFTEEKAFEYGYLSSIDYSEKKSEMSAIIYKAGTSYSKLSRSPFYFADRIKVNGETMTLDSDISDIVSILEADALATKPAGLDAENDTYAQPIRYSLNTSGKISAITTYSGTSTQEASKLVVANKSASGLACTSTGEKLGDYTISGTTKILYIPKDRAMGEYHSEPSSFFKNNKTYYAQIVNAASTKVPKCIYVYENSDDDGADISAQITADTKPMIVKAISGVNVDNSDRKFTLLDVATGEITECYDNDIAGTQSLAVGDVVRVATTVRTVYNNDGAGTDYTFVGVLQILADADEVVGGTFTSLFKTDGDVQGGNKYEFRTLIGTVKAKEGGYFTIVPGYSIDGTAETYELKSPKVYMVDTTETQQSNVVKDDVSTADFDYYGKPGISSRIMIYTNYDEVISIIIFK